MRPDDGAHENGNPRPHARVRGCRRSGVWNAGPLDLTGGGTAASGGGIFGNNSSNRQASAAKDTRARVSIVKYDQCFVASVRRSPLFRFVPVSRASPRTPPPTPSPLIHRYSRFFNSSTSATAYRGEAECKSADVYKLLALVYTPCVYPWSIPRRRLARHDKLFG